MYQQICDVLHTASKKCIPSSKIDCYKEHIVSGFNEHVKELHYIARHDFVMWRSAGKPRFGEICLSMNQSRLRFKSALTLSDPGYFVPLGVKVKWGEQC